MKPSLFRTSSTLTRSREPGVETLGFLRICALVMRAIRSPMGSFNCMRLSSPARLHKTRNEALGAKLPQRDTAELVLAIDGARATGQLAAVAITVLGRVARQLGELQRRRKALFHRLGLVHGDRLQARPAAGVFLRQLLSP